MIYPGEIRRRALETLKKNWKGALLVTLAASIPSLAFQLALNLSQQSLISAVLQYQYAQFSMDVLRRIAMAAGQSMGPAVRVLWQLVPVLFLIFPFMNLGRMVFHLKTVRGEEAGVPDVLSRAGCFLRALWLEVLTFLKTALWTVPGFAVMLLGTVLFITGQAGESTFTFLYSAGLAAMAVLGVRASLHYAMAKIIMADRPETGAWACLKESIGMMRRQVMPLLSLMLSFVLYMLLSEIVVSLVASAVYFLGLALSLGLSLLITAWMNTALCTYYEERRTDSGKPYFDETPSDLN